MSKITSVTSAVIAANFDWTIVRIETEDGVVGWGECFFAPGLPQILRAMGDLIVGDDAENIAAIGARLVAAASGAGSVGGIIFNALSGIDAALWDLNSKALGVPLWRMLGGKFHDSVRVYADCHGESGLMSLGSLLEIRPAPWSRPDQTEDAVAAGIVGRSLFDPGAETEEVDLDLLADRARQAVNKGFDALKFDLDLPGLVPLHKGSRTMPPGGESLARDIADAISEAVGPDVGIAFDMHWRYDQASAARMAAAVEHLPIMWLEDPLPPENVHGLLDLARKTNVPWGGGENLIGYRSFEPVIAAGALSVVTPDFAKFGGVSQAQRVAAESADRGIVIAPHNIAGPIGTAFAAQLSATMPNFLALEYHAQDVPFFGDLVDVPLIQHGSITMTERPGIGVELDLDVARRWAKPTESFFHE